MNTILKPASTFLRRNFQKAPFRNFITKKMRENRTKNLYFGFGISGIFAAFYYLKSNMHDEQRRLPIMDEIKTPKDPNVLYLDNKQQRQTIRNQFNFIDKVVKKCAPGVFYLEIRDPYKKDQETGEPLVTSNGSGFLISEDGWALTNAHVVLNKPQSTIRAIMRDGKMYTVQVEDADLNMDLALVKIITNESMPTLNLGEIGDNSLGEWVVALGSPLSLSNSVTVGIISCVNRPAEELGLRNYSMNYIQTDASITFGNSGGPLVNLDGNVIGINNLRLTSGISFAIPVEYLKKFLKNTKYRKQNTSKGDDELLGITAISITPEIITEFKDRIMLPDDVTQGLLVWKVLEGTSGQKNGLETGDIITHVNGEEIQETADLYSKSNNEILKLNVIKKSGTLSTIVLNLNSSEK